MVRPKGNWAERRAAHLRAQGRGTPGWRLKWWRLEQELSQAQAAKRLGCTQPSVAGFELGTREPDEALRVAIRRRTGVAWP